MVSGFCLIVSIPVHVLVYRGIMVFRILLSFLLKWARKGWPRCRDFSTSAFWVNFCFMMLA